MEVTKVELLPKTDKTSVLFFTWRQTGKFRDAKLARFYEL